MRERLQAEQIADQCADRTGTLNRQAIENLFEVQTPPKIFQAALQRADGWPQCDDTPERRYGLQYAYLLEFLICDETRQAAQRNGGVNDG